MIKHITIPHFNIASAGAFIHSAFTIPARAKMQGYLSASDMFIIIEVIDRDALIATFICHPLPKEKRA